MSFSNPMGFSCRPNEAGPNVCVETSLERFVAYGMFVCFDYLHGQGTEALKPERNDVYWLRNHFLDTLDLARDNVRDMLDDPEDEVVEYDGLQDQGGFLVKLRKQPKGTPKDDPAGVIYEWRFAHVKVPSDTESGDVMLELTYRDNDPEGTRDQHSIWLDLRTLMGDDFDEVMASAREFNENNKTAPKEAVATS